jgi:hypothetical protein
MDISTVILENMIKSVGGMDELIRRRRQFRQNLDFIEHNRDELLEHYNENWIAVHNSEVIAHGKDYNRVITGLQKQKKPVEEIPIRYMSKQKFFALYFH